MASLSDWMGGHGRIGGSWPDCLPPIGSASDRWTSSSKMNRGGLWRHINSKSRQPSAQRIQSSQKKPNAHLPYQISPCTHCKRDLTSMLIIIAAYYQLSNVLPHLLPRCTETTCVVQLSIELFTIHLLRYSVVEYSWCWLSDRCTGLNYSARPVHFLAPVHFSARAGPRAARPVDTSVGHKR